MLMLDANARVPDEHHSIPCLSLSPDDWHAPPFVQCNTHTCTCYGSTISRVPAAAERPAYLFPLSHSVAAVRPGELTLFLFLFLLVTLADAMRSLDVSRIARSQ